MRVKKTVTGPQLSEYFKLENKYYDLSHNLRYNSQLFNNFVCLTVMVVLFIPLGFLNPVFWAVASGITGLTTLLYFKTKKLAHGISISRKVPKFSREESEILIEYVFTNETGFHFSELVFEDQFDGVKEGRIRIESAVRAQTKVMFTQKVLLNDGMGIKTFCPLKVSVQDELGLFHFIIQFHESHEIEVYPLIEETPLFKNALSPDSIDYGFYEISKRGDSNLFIGTRDYRHGDPVKHINWKLTKKTNQVVVNEYEKNTNTFITLLMDLDLKNQLGVGKLSTWEAAKDLALSLMANELKRNNMIQVLCHNLYLPFSSGKSQLTTLERHFTFHELNLADSNQHLSQLLNLPSESQVYYICPMVTTSAIVETFTLLKKLKVSGQHIMIFALDPYEDLIKSIKGDMRVGMMEMERHAREEFAKHSHAFQSMGVKMVMVKVGENHQLNQELMKHALELLETK